MQPRWSDIVDECTLTDDVADEVQDNLAYGDHAYAVAPTKSGRRRRGRGARSKFAEGNVTSGADETQVEVMNESIQSNALTAAVVQDSAAKTLADLGLLISMPGSQPVTQWIGQTRIMMTPVCSEVPDMACPQAVAEASCPRPSSVRGMPYPSYGMQPGGMPFVHTVPCVQYQ